MTVCTCIACKCMPSLHTRPRGVRVPCVECVHRSRQIDFGLHSLHLNAGLARRSTQCSRGISHSPWTREWCASARTHLPLCALARAHEHAVTRCAQDADLAYTSSLNLSARGHEHVVTRCVECAHIHSLRPCVHAWLRAILPASIMRTLCEHAVRTVLVNVYSDALTLTGKESCRHL